MKKLLTIHLVVKNRNYSNLEKTIQSIKSLNCQIVLISTGEKDYGCNLRKIKNLNNISEELNKSIEETDTDWQMYIHPYEVLTNQGKILGAIEEEKENKYNILIYQNGVITKDVRLWKKSSNIKFINPIYETLYPTNNVKNIDCIIHSNPLVSNKDDYNIICSWKDKNPTSSEPYYYEAFWHLENKQYKEFIRSAEHYLAREEKAKMPVVIMKYYYAMVKCYSKVDIDKAIQHILACIAIKPLMAEFWCLLGDIYYNNLKYYTKARIAYENAKVLGSRRPMDDEWIIDIAKYNNYPDKMINSCASTINMSNFYFG